METISFDAPDLVDAHRASDAGKDGSPMVLEVTPEMVTEKVGDLLEKSDLSKFIL